LLDLEEQGVAFTSQEEDHPASSTDAHDLHRGITHLVSVQQRAIRAGQGITVDGDELRSSGFYLDVAPWQCHVFSMTRIS